MIPMRRSIKAVLFDLDETLLADRAGTMEAVRRVSSALAPHVPHIEPSVLLDTYIHVMDAVWSNLGSVPKMPDATASGGQAIRIHVR